VKWAARRRPRPRAQATHRHAGTIPQVEGSTIDLRHEPAARSDIRQKAGPHDDGEVHSDGAEGRDGLLLSMEIHLASSGALTGWLRATNVSGRTVRLSHKPTVKPLGLDGRPLPVDCVVTLEARIPDYVDVDPGQEAMAPVGWGGWSGAPASGAWEVELEVMEPPVRVEATGPREPTWRGPGTNTWSSWWQIAGATAGRDSGMSVG
jgi:hypothetical protein